jgi:hypothetical protein
MKRRSTVAEHSTPLGQVMNEKMVLGEDENPLDHSFSAEFDVPAATKTESGNNTEERRDTNSPVSTQRTIETETSVESP